MTRRLRRMIVLVLVGWVATGLLASAASQRAPLQTKFAGRPLGDVLRELQATGLNIVFSSEIVRPTMKVLTEPKAVLPRKILDEILRPHGLQVRSGPGGALLVVPAAGTPVTVGPSSSGRGAVFRVPIYATVTDARGVLIPNLGMSDFQIDDDGRRQAITFFKSGIQPMTIAVLLDSSPSLFDVALRLQKAVTEFVGHLRPDDRACLGTFSHVVTLNPALTGDHDVLLRRLGDDAPYPAGTALWDAIEAGRAAVSAEGGRRVVLVVTDASDNSSVADIDALRTRVEREGVMVYGVGVRGLEGLQTRELSAIARSTGGWYFELKSTDDVAAAMLRVADELHRQYVLGFSPRTLDDKLHRIDVKIKARALTVHARAFVFRRPAHADIR